MKGARMPSWLPYALVAAIAGIIVYLAVHH